MMTRQSLEELIDLSKNPKYQKVIKELEVCHVVFSRESRSAINGRPLSPDEKEAFQAIVRKHNLAPVQYEWPVGQVRNPSSEIRHWNIWDFERKLKHQRRIMHDKQMHDQNTMRTQGIDVELLTTALKNLPALRSIRLTSFDAGRLPFAGKKLFREIGVWPSHFPPSRQEAYFPETHSISVILGALVRSGCLLESLGFHLVPYRLPLARTSTSRKVSRKSTPAKTFAQDQFDQLNVSKINSLTFGTLDIENGTTWSSSHQAPLSWVTTMLNRTTGLRKLGLTGPVVRPYPFSDVTLVNYLATGTVSLPTVHTLELRRIGFKVRDFERLLGKFKSTLRSFTCFECWAIDQTNEKLLCALREMPALTYADLLLCSPRTRMKQKCVIEAKTPADFQTQLDGFFYFYSERIEM